VFKFTTSRRPLNVVHSLLISATACRLDASPHPSSHVAQLIDVALTMS